MKNGRCRLHGGLSTGPKTLEGLSRSRVANWKHGKYSADKVVLKKSISASIRECRELLKNLSNNKGS